MRPDVRLNGWGYCLPGPAVSSEQLASRIGTSADLGRETGIRERHFSEPGHGPSGLAAFAAEGALAQAGVGAEALSMLVFATTTPDVAFPGSACFLQEKLGAATVGALDVRAQSAGFIAGLDMAAAFCGTLHTDDGAAPVLVAAAEVFSSTLDFSPSGEVLASRLADGAAVTLVSSGGQGPRLLDARWYTDGTLAEKFWTDAPHGWQLGGRLLPHDLASGNHYPQSDLPALRDLARERLLEVVREACAATETDPASVAHMVIDYVEPDVAHGVAVDLGCRPDGLSIPTAAFGHVMTAGSGIEMARNLEGLASGERMVLASAGPGFTWGAAVIEAD